MSDTIGTTYKDVCSANSVKDWDNFKVKKLIRLDLPKIYSSVTILEHNETIYVWLYMYIYIFTYT